MERFLDCLAYAYQKAYKMKSSDFNKFLAPYVKALVDTGEWTQDQLVHDDTSPIEQDVRDWFHTECTRCPVCNEWELVDNLVEARYDVNGRICSQCREDGN